MSAKKIIAVVGATGAQGGGLVRAILKDGEFAVRAITRDPSSDNAKALAALGAEICVANVDDVASLAQAFTGAYGAFCVTFFWHHFSAEQETAQATNMANACKAAGVQHVIWSSLEDTRDFIPLSDNRMPTLQGKYKVPHFDAKGEANGIFTSLGLPVTILNTSFYWENFIFFGLGPTKGPDGNYAITFPIGSAKLPGIAAEDIGKCALGVFKAGSQYIGKTVSIAGDHVTGAQMAAKMGETLGLEVGFNAPPPDVYRSFGFQGADEMGNMFQFKADFEKEFVGARDLKLAKALNPELQSFDDWMAANGKRIAVN